MYLSHLFLHGTIPSHFVSLSESLFSVSAHEISRHHPSTTFSIKISFTRQSTSKTYPAVYLSPREKATLLRDGCEYTQIVFHEILQYCRPFLLLLGASLSVVISFLDERIKVTRAFSVVCQVAFSLFNLFGLQYFYSWWYLLPMFYTKTSIRVTAEASPRTFIVAVSSTELPSLLSGRAPSILSRILLYQYSNIVVGSSRFHQRSSSYWHASRFVISCSTTSS